MSHIPEPLVKKIRCNIEKIGFDLREFPGTQDGFYLKNREKALPIGHIFNWTQSFFTGMALWAYQDTGDRQFLDWTLQFRQSYADKVNLTPLETMHDLGFLYSPYAVMLYEITGDEAFRQIGVRAADALAMRFEPKGRYIRAWGRMDGRTPDYVDPILARDHFFTQSRGLAIIDSMMNLPLLFWASQVTGHPFYARIAMCHADTTRRCFFRPDNTVMHAYRFSEETGEPLGEANYCGWSHGSWWARGTAWAIYGFAIAYRYTRREEYLDTAFKLLESFMAACRGQIPLWDFRLPAAEDQALDTSSAAIVLCAILEIMKIKEDMRLPRWRDQLRRSLAEFINEDENVMGILSEQDGTHVYAPYGDYFLIESFMKEESNVRLW